VIAVDGFFCGLLDGLDRELDRLARVRVRPTNRRQLDEQMDRVELAVLEIRTNHDRHLADPVEAVRRAEVELALAVENYTTMTDPDQAAGTLIGRRQNAVERTLRELRARTDCPPPPTRAPVLPDASDAGGSSPPDAAASTPPG
jgi:hypothetical protein